MDKFKEIATMKFIYYAGYGITENMDMHFQSIFVTENMDMHFQSIL